MKFINTKVHAFLDYSMGLLLIVSPWLFGFYQGDMESWILIILGGFLLIYSLFTNYEWSISRSISMRTHLILDFCSGFFLALSPWLFGFADDIFWPHLVFGIAEMGAAVFTKNTTDDVRRTDFQVQV